MIRKHYPIELKLKIVQECLETRNCAIVARKYGISSNLVNRWTRYYRKYGEAAFKSSSTKPSIDGTFHIEEHKKVLSENEKLKKILGYHLRGQHRIRHSGGRPISGYSFDDKGQLIDDDQIKEWLLQLIQGEGEDLRLPKVDLCPQTEIRPSHQP